jgi:hypothetical protein
MFTMPMVLAALALLGSVVLVVRHRPLLFPIIALIVSVIEVLMVFGLVHISVVRVPLGFIFGAALVLAGVGTYLKSMNRAAIAAATAVAIAGALQAISLLHLH